MRRGGDRAQADGKQGHGAADCQGDPGGGPPIPSLARRCGGDFTEETGGERAGMRGRWLDRFQQL